MSWYQEQSVLTKKRVYLKVKTCKHETFQVKELNYIFMTISSQYNWLKWTQERNIDCKIKRQKGKEQELCRKFIWIDPGKEDFDIFTAINEILRQIIQSTKKTLTNKISSRLLGLEFKSDNTIQYKAVKYIVKKILPDYK